MMQIKNNNFNNNHNKYDNNKYDNNKYDNNKYDNNKYDNNNKYNKYDNKFDNKYDNKNENKFENDNVNSSVKEAILDYLYNRIEIGDHKYTIIKNVGDIYELKNNRYYVSGNSCGINSIIIFMKKNNNYYSYLIDRRSISYNRQSLNKSKVRFTEIKLSVDLKLYEGTIIDGILIDNETNKLSLNNTKININENMLFMITDVFLLNGKSVINMNYKKKMFVMNDMINKFVEKNNKNNIELFISQPYELNQIPNLFEEYISNNNKKYNIKGIVFYPEISGSKLIYIFDKNDEKIKDELMHGSININNLSKINDEPEIKELITTDKKTIFRYEIKNIENINDIKSNLEMKKTLITDVYKLYGIFIYNNNKYIKRKIGIAYIPTFILSLKCKNLFLNKESIIMNCILNINKNKWMPIEESEIHKIDIINNDSNFKIIEEVLEENDDIVDED